MAKAVADCLWLHIHAPGCNGNVHNLEDVNLLGVYYLVLKALNEEAIETAPIVNLEASDNSCVARLNLRGRVWWQIKQGCVTNVTTDANCINGICALQLSIIKRKLRPAIRASNPFNYSRKMTCVIQAFGLLRYLHPKLSWLTFLKQRGFLYLPMTRSGSLSEPSALQHTASVRHSLFCLRLSSCFVAKELSAC
jgi:hypothetical protein